MAAVKAWKVGQPGAPYFPDDFEIVKKAVLQVTDIKSNHNKYYAIELHRANYGANGERLGFDLYPYTEDAVGAVKRSVLQWRFLDGIAAKIDDEKLREIQHRKDAIAAYELVYEARGAPPA